MNTSPVYPRSYQAASAILHDSRRQWVLLHDDLTLAFVSGAVVVIFRRKPIIRWPCGGREVILVASGPLEHAMPATVEHIQKFLPRGWHVELNGGEMQLTHRDGRTTMGNTQHITLRTERQYYDPM